MLIVESPQHGAVTSVSAIASQIGLDVLCRGGNAADAAVAMAATLAVVDPAMTGVGGDAFALVQMAGDRPVALNASGAAPKLAAIELGCIGADMQPQGLLMLLTELLDHESDIDQALAAPRWRSHDDHRLALEPGLASLGPELSRRGHRLVSESIFGVAQILERQGDGTLRAATDPRVPGAALGR